MEVGFHFEVIGYSIFVQEKCLRGFSLRLLLIRYCSLGFLTNLGFIREMGDISMINGDNLVIEDILCWLQHYKYGGGERVRSELESACGCFKVWDVLLEICFDFVVSIRWVHWLFFPLTTEFYKEKSRGGNPFALANQVYRFCTLTLRTNYLKSLSFYSQNDYSPIDRRGNISLS